MEIPDASRRGFNPHGMEYAVIGLKGAPGQSA